MRYDDRGLFDPLAIGTFRRIHDGPDVEAIETFVCHVCGEPAEHLPIRYCEAHGSDDDFPESRKTSMTIEWLYYTCSEHISLTSDQVCDQHGWSTNDGPMQQPTFRRIEEE